MASGPAYAAGDIDLLSYDPIPQKRESDAPPVEVVSPEIQSMPAAPVAAAQPEPTPVTSTPVIEDEAPPVVPDKADLKIEPAHAQPPVDVTPQKAERPPVAKKEQPPLVHAPVKKQAPVKPVKDAAKPAVVPAPQKAEAVPPPPAKAVPAPVIRPVMKVTEPAAVKESFKVQADPNKKTIPEPAPLKQIGPKPVTVPPPTLNAEISPVHPDVLDHPPVEQVKKAVLAEPPPAPESFVKMKETVIQNGDPVRIEVEGESDLSGWYKVSDEGAITMPIIGRVRAQGFTHAKLAEILTATLKDGYLVNPQVAVTGKATP